MLRLRRVDGSGMWVEVTARADCQPGRKGHRVEAVIRDVTERKTLQDQSRDRLPPAAAGRKTGLAGPDDVRRGARAEQSARDDPRVRRAPRQPRAGAVYPPRPGTPSTNAAERAARIVRNLQTFARKRHTTRATVELNQVLRDTLALRAHEQRAAHIRIVDALAAGLPPIFADPHQIQQILLNLIMNAEQAMLAAHGRGTLVLRSWQDPDRDAVVLEVYDDGPGVPVETQLKIFDPFFTTKAVGKGTGLGLTVVYAIAQEHGGRLRVASDGQRGASFFLELPVGALTVRVPETVRVPAPPSVPSGARALGGRGRACARRGRGGHADRRGFPRRSRRERRRSARPHPRPALRRDYLRLENAEAGRHGVLRGSLEGDDAEDCAAPGVRDGRRGGIGRGTVSGREADAAGSRSQFGFAISCGWLEKRFRRPDAGAGAPASAGPSRRRDAFRGRGGAAADAVRRSCGRATRRPSRACLRRGIARACSCETRDSFTPIAKPICFIVASSE